MVNCGDNPLNPPEKKFNENLSQDSLSRREFLTRCCQGASMAMIPAGLSAFPFPYSLSADPDSANKRPRDPDFYLQPHYRTARDLDALLSRRLAGSDAFISEKYADQIAAILAEWSAGLLSNPQEVDAIAKSLAADFSGSSFHAADSHSVRNDPWLQVWRNQFPVGYLQRNAFLEEFRTAMINFSKIITAEFQATSIEATSPETRQPMQIRSLVRYELVGTGSDFYREQRVGYWDLSWIVSSGNDLLLKLWTGSDETRSRSRSPLFADITAAALGNNSSYAAQMMHGIDYWRTVLDGACGIDIYGHNGVSVADIDNDGFDDLYICQPAGLPNRLYRNRGDRTFEDTTEASGLGILENTSCALFADFDNDGKQDVIVVRAEGPILFVNEGSGRFRRQPDAFRFANSPQGTFTGAAVADYDCDGWLDIYFCLYVFYQGTDQYKYPVPYHDARNGPPNFMFKNNRDGTFRDVTRESGLDRNNNRYSFCCGWCDYDHDGWPDLYVVNDFGRKNLYRNNGDGTFADVAAEAGVEDVGAGMSVCWFDYNNDSAEDLYVADMWTAAGERISSQEIFKKESPEQLRSLYRKHAMGNSLFRNGAFNNEHHAATFQDRTETAHVQMGRWAWSSDAFDFDHDGYADLYITNGMVSGRSQDDLNSFFWRQVVANSPDVAKSAPAYEEGWSAVNELIRSDATWSGFERNVFYANNRDGSFSDVSGTVGLDFVEDGRSFALADFDGDGRQEVLLKNRNAPQLRLLKNVIEDLPPSISFRLRGTRSNRDAIGATITIETELGRQVRSLQAGSGFLAQHSKELFFGLSAAKGPVHASIRWPSSLVQNFGDLPIGHRVWVEEGSAKLRIEPYKTISSPGKELSVASSKNEELPGTVETWLLTPVSAPDLSLPDLSGQVSVLSRFRGKPLLLHFFVTDSASCQNQLAILKQVQARWLARGITLLAVNADNSSDIQTLWTFARTNNLPFPILRGSDDVIAIYNIVYRYLFDRRRDMGLPASFLLDENGDIVKVYQGVVGAVQIEQDAQRIPRDAAAHLARALPFAGNAETFEYGRNYLSYGSNLFQHGYFDQAAASFQRALQDDPTSAEACYGLGSAYLNLQKPAEARTNFERATKLHASYPDTLTNAWNNLGLLDTREGKPEDAVRNFQQALKLNPEHTIALDNLGNAYRILKRWDDAQTTFERALAVNNDDSEANYGLGMVYAQADDTDHAFDYLQRALKVRPHYPEALNNLGILLLRTQRRDDAVRSFEECIRAAPRFDQCYLNLAKVYVLEGAPDKAREVLLALLKQYPDHPKARNLLDQLPR
jgi:tetratricopeptide (TPR) repeat protein